MMGKEIVRALRCISTACNATDRNCPECGYFRKWFGCDVDRLSTDAADAIERLRAENAALLEYAKTMQECEMCKNDSFCHLRDPMKDDCKHCQRASDCPCQKCEENNCWAWRGLPAAPTEGDKA